MSLFLSKYDIDSTNGEKHLIRDIGKAPVLALMKAEALLRVEKDHIIASCD